MERRLIRCSNLVVSARFTQKQSADGPRGNALRFPPMREVYLSLAVEGAGFSLAPYCQLRDPGVSGKHEFRMNSAEGKCMEAVTVETRGVGRECRHILNETGRRSLAVSRAAISGPYA